MAMQPYRASTDSINRIFDSLQGLGGSAHGLMRAPETDVMETENEIRVHTELPGMRPDDIEVDIENNVLTIRGEKREEREEGGEGARYHLSERRYGTLARSFVLPRDVDADRISASFDNGVLEVVIPKSEKARRRRIEIGGGDGSREVGQGGEG
jgi:HSP20 family protein